MCFLSSEKGDFSAFLETPDRRRNHPISVEVNDDTHLAYPEADIDEDPMELPSESELIHKLHQQALKHSRDMIGNSFDQWRQMLLAAAITAPSDDERGDQDVLDSPTTGRGSD